MSAFLLELRHAAQRLRRSPGFTLAAVLTLAVAIGASTAVFSVVDRVLLRPLDLPDADRVVVVWKRLPDIPVPVMYASPPDVHDWRVRARSFEALGGYYWRSYTIGGEDPEQVSGVRVTAGALEALGVQPRLGRLFREGEDRAGASPVAILSDALWRRHFDADPQVLGRVVTIDGEPVEVVGVMPPGFGSPPPLTLEGTPPVERAEIWVPHATDLETGQRGAHYLTVVARLRPGVGVEAASREMNDIQAQIEAELSDEPEDRGAVVVPLADEVLNTARRPVTMLGIAITFMLLLACANVANLLLARGMRRRRELDIRAALGAGLGRLAAPLLAESIVLAFAGCAAGILLASELVRLIVTHGPPTVPGLADATMDVRVLGFAVLVSVLAAVLTGAAPALRSVRVEGLGLGERSAAAQRPVASRLQRALSVGQVAIAVAVLVAAGLLVESFRQLSRVDPGFRAESVVTARTFLPAFRYGSDSDRLALMDRFLAEARGLPGVLAVGMGDGLPLADQRQGTGIWRADRPQPDEPAHSNVAWVTDGYFEALGMPLLEGRTFATRDDADAPAVLVLNARLARVLFGQEDPIGRGVRIGMVSGATFEVVGVVGGDRNIALDTEPKPTFFLPLRQRPDAAELAIAARVDGSAEAVLPGLRAVVRRLDPELPFFDARTMSQIISESVATPRSLAWLLGGFALSGLLVATLGVFGVLAYAVGQRKQEIGVRLAVGATPQRILHMVLGQGLTQISAGLLLGFAIAIALSRFLAGLLFGVTPFSPLTYAAVAGLVAVVGIAASLLPARQATRVDPVIALRED